MTDPRPLTEPARFYKARHLMAGDVIDLGTIEAVREESQYAVLTTDRGEFWRERDELFVVERSRPIVLLPILWHERDV